jgi:hypothetical protein
MTRNSQIFLLFSVISALAFGVDIASHQTYNLTELFMLRTNASEILGTYGFNFNPKNLMYYYLIYIVPILEYGYIYILSSILIKFLIFTIIYKVSAILIDKDLAVLTTIIFILGYSAHSHGVVEIGFWKELGFFPAVISSLMTILGLNNFLKGNYLTSGFQFSLSVLIHPLYGVCALSFLSLGFLMMLIKNKGKDHMLGILSGFVMILLSIGYIAFFRISGGMDTLITHSFVEWYNFSIYTDAADVSLLSTLKDYGYLMFPLFLGGLYTSVRQKEYGNIEILTIGSLIFTIVCLSIEIFHFFGIFFEKFSELFIASQFRRGIWITSMFSLLAIFKYIYINKGNISKNNSHVMLVVFLIATYLFPSVFSLLIASMLLFLVFRNLISSVLLFLSSFMVLVHYSYGDFDGTWQLKTMFYGFVFSAIVISGYLSILFQTDKPLIRLSKLILSSLCILFISQGLLKSSLSESASVLTSNGAFKKTDMQKVSTYVKLFPFDQDLDQCMQNVSNKNGNEKIQLPINGLRNTKNALFSFPQVFGYYNPMYSRKDYQESKNKLESIFGRDIAEDFLSANESYNKEIMHEYFLKAYNSLSEKQLILLRDEENLRFYLANNQRSSMGKALICNSKEYFVYDLSLIS